MGTTADGASTPPSGRRPGLSLSDLLSEATGALRAGWEAENRATGLRYKAAHEVMARCIDHPDCADDAEVPRPGRAVIAPEVMAGSYLVRELAISSDRAERMLSFAADLHFRYPAILQAMLDGLMEERTAQGLAAQMSCVHDDHLARIQQQVVDDYLATLASGTILGDHARNARADAIIGRYDPDGIRIRKTDAARRRGVWFRKGQDGMSTMNATLRSDEAAVLAEAIDAKVAQDLAAEKEAAAAAADAAAAAAADADADAARDNDTAGPAADSSSTHDTDTDLDADTSDDEDDDEGEGEGEGDHVYTRAQRRADVLMAFGCGDTATGTNTDTDTGAGSAAAATPEAADEPAAADDVSDQSGTAGDDRGAEPTEPTGPTGPTGPAGPKAPTGGSGSAGTGSGLVLRPKVTVITHPGGGTAGVQFARTGEAALQGLLDLLATCDGATLEPVDPTPGSADRPDAALVYKPGAELARRIRLRDGTCRHPGCTIPAEDCDLDHCIPYNHTNPASGGHTVESNLGALCRRHHRFKTFNDWQYAMTADGTLTITTPDGRTITTHPTGPLATYRSQQSADEDAAWDRQQRRHTDPDKPRRRTRTSWATKTGWARRAERRQFTREQDRVASRAAQIQAERDAILADILAAYSKAYKERPEYENDRQSDRIRKLACQFAGIRITHRTAQQVMNPADDTPHSHSHWWTTNSHNHRTPPGPDPTNEHLKQLRDQLNNPPPF